MIVNLVSTIDDLFKSNETWQPGRSSHEAPTQPRLRLDEPWHGNVLLSCGPQKLEPKQQLQEFNADFVPCGIRRSHCEGRLEWTLHCILSESICIRHI